MYYNCLSTCASPPVSVCNVGDPGSFPGSGASAGEGIGYSLQYSWAFPVAQFVKNTPAMQDTCVRSLGWEDPLEKGPATHSSILAWTVPWTVWYQRVGHDWVTFTPPVNMILSIFIAWWIMSKPKKYLWMRIHSEWMNIILSEEHFHVIREDVVSCTALYVKTQTINLQEIKTISFLSFPGYHFW